MPAIRERRVPVGDHVLQARPKGFIDWDGAHLFLELVRNRSFRATAEHIELSFNAVRRRIAAFERSLGVTLITRHNDGIRLTAEGETILAAVQQMEQAAFALVQARDRTNQTLTGEIRLAITEGLGTFWLAPYLVDFQRANPKLMLDVICAMHSADVLRLEADISVQLTRPTAKELLVTKLGRLHLVPFAAQSYLDTFGVPKTIAELRNHRIVLQSDEHSQAKQLYDHVFPGTRPEGLISLRTNVSSANYWSITKGAGIGMLPTYVHAIGAPIVPVDLDVHLPVDIWMTYHPGAARIPRVRRLSNWLVTAFSPKTFPWFRDEFIRPEELAKSYLGRTPANPFSGFAGASRPRV
ncbi:MAG: LysR family transcriptional regulator [Alphaproteobacteria bacterium]|nr:LysR family transcriptional regulator [Alphaproteobacteria bacterium]